MVLLSLSLEKAAEEQKDLMQTPPRLRELLTTVRPDLVLAVLDACAAVPLLAGLDFARSLADDRAVLRTLRALLNALQQQNSAIDTSVVPPAVPHAAHRAGTLRRLRVDLGRGPHGAAQNQRRCAE